MEEYWVRAICRQGLDICDCDGYTLDFLSYNLNDIYVDLPSLSNFRELCILNNRNVDVVRVVTGGRRKTRRNKKMKSKRRYKRSKRRGRDD